MAEFLKCIRLVTNEYIPKTLKYEYKPNIDSLINQASGAKDRWFEDLAPDQRAEKVVDIMVNSVKNMRKGLAIDPNSKKSVMVGHAIQRASYLGELEFKYVYSLNCPAYPVGQGSAYYNTIMMYIEGFYDKADVVGDLKQYLRLFSSTEA